MTTAIGNDIYFQIQYIWKYPQLFKPVKTCIKWHVTLKWIYYYLAFQSFNHERTWWRLFQKRVVHTKFDIYVDFFTVNHFTRLIDWLVFNANFSSTFYKIPHPHPHDKHSTWHLYYIYILFHNEMDRHTWLDDRYDHIWSNVHISSSYHTHLKM